MDRCRLRHSLGGGNEELQRDIAVQPDIFRPVHDTHAPAAEQLRDAVMKTSCRS
jgi:hypothetical protein